MQFNVCLMPNFSVQCITFRPSYTFFHSLFSVSLFLSLCHSFFRYLNLFLSLLHSLFYSLFPLAVSIPLSSFVNFPNLLYLPHCKICYIFILFLSFQVKLHKLLLIIKLLKEKRYIYYIIKIKKDSFNEAKKSFSM